jgi:hypothetical protein
MKIAGTFVVREYYEVVVDVETEDNIEHVLLVALDSALGRTISPIDIDTELLDYEEIDSK